MLFRSAQLLGVALDADGAAEIASRSRGTPRIANRLLRRVRDYAEVRADGRVTADIAHAALAVYDVDQLGLDRLDRAVLDALVRRFGGGPVGVGTLAVAVGEEVETVEEVAEPFLVRAGLLARTPRGRVATPAAWEHLGLSGPRPSWTHALRRVDSSGVNALPYVVIVVLLGGMVLFSVRNRRRQVAEEMVRVSRIEVGTDVMTTSGPLRDGRRQARRRHRAAHHRARRRGQVGRPPRCATRRRCQTPTGAPLSDDAERRTGRVGRCRRSCARVATSRPDSGGRCGLAQVHGCVGHTDAPGRRLTAVPRHGPAVGAFCDRGEHSPWHHPPERCASGSTFLPCSHCSRSCTRSCSSGHGRVPSSASIWSAAPRWSSPPRRTAARPRPATP